jgi:hypothetical protein
MKRLLIAIALFGFSSGCALSLGNPQIADLQHNPGRYQDLSVNIDGVVTSSWGLPLVPFSFYKVDDGTGESRCFPGAANADQGRAGHVKDCG